ncbi:Sec-independent protein translocase subunit TatA/TatB [Pedobacter sp. SL55]|uniref:Sec-independent protein translocase subunit TatA/TatB n=1 Tax=Pedobacter sp. SL55 TaxID=2995161 RepID=UPI002270E4E3|nr:twin-arginine translocase TatA/TatE family subunit [Pedobacter sp. SL55]WAC41409.1 twin-arginine translocase TatA/TatE family subunit [Pedobacter sp. SL55]
MYSTPLLEFLNMGGGEMMLIVIAILLLFGGKKLPELARGLGKGIREFKDASEGVKREIHRNINSFDTDEEDRKADENRRYREPEVDNSHSIHDEPTVSTENQNATAFVDNKEDKEPKSSI